MIEHRAPLPTGVTLCTTFKASNDIIDTQCRKNAIARLLTSATNLLCTYQTSLCDSDNQHDCGSLDADSSSVLVLTARFENLDMVPPAPAAFCAS